MPTLIMDNGEPVYSPTERAAIRNGEPEHQLRFPVSHPETCRAYVRITSYHALAARARAIELVSSWNRVLGRFYRNQGGEWQFVADPDVGPPVLSEKERVRCAQILFQQTPGAPEVPNINWPSALGDMSKPFKELAKTLGPNMDFGAFHESGINPT